MSDFILQLQAVWPLIMQAPWVFATLAALLLFAGWVAGRFMYGERIKTLESRVAARDEKIAELSGNRQDDETRQREYLIGQLTAQYQAENPDAPRRVKMGLELPPADWMNAELAKLEENWRVTAGPDGSYKYYEPARWG
jgi:hypothetical protein